ncbi:MAG TPA: class I SAM-dependent methyltransferase [Methylomirabilota bacterium]|nr:class I SAM-dependent methyltransferase [Methylomirabilota bacterium]
MGDVRSFYDDLAPLYHLIFENWDASVARQGSALAALIGERWGRDARVVLDGAVGIGTQALGLLARGFRVIGSDISLGAVRRARQEAAARGLRLPAVVADFRALAAPAECADVVLVADNALPHLDGEADIATALRECFRCTRPGGGCLITMRDYDAAPPAGTVETRPYGERSWNGRRYDVRQVWTWRGRRYDVSFEITPLDVDAAERKTVLATSYLAIPVAEVQALVSQAGFIDVARIDGRFFQPVIAGTRPRRA